MKTLRDVVVGDTVLRWVADLDPVLLETGYAPPIVQLNANPTQVACHTVLIQASGQVPDGAVDLRLFHMSPVPETLGGGDSIQSPWGHYQKNV